MTWIYNPFTDSLDKQAKFKDLTEAFVPYSDGIANNSTGIKGQWSWNPKEGTLLFCIASNTWVDLYTLENIIKDNFIKHDDAIEVFIPYSKLVSTNYKGIKGQWSYSLDYFYLCIATDTWKVIADKNYVDAEDLKTRLGAGLENDGSYLADTDTSYIALATSLKDADIKLDENLKRIDDELSLIDEQYVSFGLLQQNNFKGIKGNWSYNDKRYYKCIATDTWLIIPSEELVDNKIAKIFKEFSDQYVPCCLVPNNSATGLKGQWSFQVGHSSHKGYIKICIATDTWVRFEVDTLF